VTLFQGSRNSFSSSLHFCCELLSWHRGSHIFSRKDILHYLLSFHEPASLSVATKSRANILIPLLQRFFGVNTLVFVLLEKLGALVYGPQRHTVIFWWCFIRT